MRIDTYEDHPDVKMNWPIILRSLQKPNKLKFKLALLNSLKEVDLYTESGIYLGKTAIHSVDPQKINRIIERICKGIFYI